jgi:pimeloyl-ACP methyl ester carboxylesterase
MHIDTMTNGTNPVLLPGERGFSLDMEDDQRLRGYIRDTGNGPVGIYLHGFRSHCNGEKSQQLARHAARLNRSWLRFDLRGHGKSDGNPEEQTISSGLDDLLHVIDAFTDRPVILHGSSMGAWICLLAALRRETTVAGMMLIAPAFNFVQNVFSSLPEPVLQQWKSTTYMSFPDAYGEGTYSLKYGIIDDAKQYDVMNSEIQLDIPIHIVHGENDSIVPVNNTEKFIQHAQLSQLVFEKIPAAGHRLTDQLPLLMSHIDQLWQEIYR